MTFAKLTQFWKRFKAESQQGDLFEYAQLQQKKQAQSGETEAWAFAPAVAHGKKRSYRAALGIALLILLLAFAGGYVFGRASGVCEIGRTAMVYRFQGAKERGYLRTLADGRLYLAQNEKDPHYDPQGDEGPYIELDDVRRIDLFPPEKEEETSRRELRTDEKRFIGRYRIRVSQHRGLLYVYKTKKGNLGASIRFTNWGRRQVEYLMRVRVWKRKIYFRRACYGQRCVQIGASRLLKQDFEGLLSPNRKKITGTYTGGQSGSRWYATRY